MKLLTMTCKIGTVLYIKDPNIDLIGLFENSDFYKKIPNYIDMFVVAWHVAHVPGTTATFTESG